VLTSCGTCSAEASSRIVDHCPTVRPCEGRITRGYSCTGEGAADDAAGGAQWIGAAGVVRQLQRCTIHPPRGRAACIGDINRRCARCARRVHRAERAAAGQIIARALQGAVGAHPPEPGSRRAAEQDAQAHDAGRRHPRRFCDERESRCAGASRALVASDVGALAAARRAPGCPEARRPPRTCTAGSAAPHGRRRLNLPPSASEHNRTLEAPKLVHC